MTTATAAVTKRVDDYSNLRTLPAALGGFFGLASLVQFGGVDPMTFHWAEYTLTQADAMWISIASLMAAFLSSETTDFKEYATWEQGVMGGGLLTILAYSNVGFVEELFLAFGEGGQMIAFLLAFSAWGVATAGGKGGRS